MTGAFDILYSLLRCCIIVLGLELFHPFRYLWIGAGVYVVVERFL